MDEIGQYLPSRGRVLDLGCGFGLFSLYFAQTHPDVHFEGFDLNAGRIATARRAAARLGIRNVTYEVGDALDIPGTTSWDSVYVLDVVHHVPPHTVPRMICRLQESLPPGGRLIIKDLDTSPAWKRWYAHALDWAMCPSSVVRYWSPVELGRVLDEAGFGVHQHAMVDWLPYPHMLYVCTRR